MGRMGFATLCFFLFVAFFEVLFFCFGQLLLVLGGCARMSYTPGPSQEGRFGILFVAVNELFSVL